MSKRIITISREFGSGGRTIGKMVADQLGIAFYDKELIEKIAEETGFSKKFIEEYGEHAPGTNVFSYSFLGRDAMGVSMQDKIWMMQRKLILDLAEKESCVIVGRCADYALSDNPDCINIFIHADLDVRIKNVSRNLNITENKARDIINKTDKQRASYYNYYTSKKWGDSKSYNLSLDAGKLGTDNCVEMILKFRELMDAMK